MPRRKRRNAWASITEVRAGECYRIRYWSAGPDGYKRRSRTVRGSRLDAERVRSELMLLHSDDAPCPTVGEVWDSYALPDLQRRNADGDVSDGTLKQYGYAWRKHVQPVWGHVQCDAVRPLAVQQWLYGATISAAKQGIVLLRLVLDYAVRYELVDHNVMRERYLMPSASTAGTRDKGVWTLDELGEVWRIVHGTWVEGAFILAGFGGLRVGEALGVRGTDVELRRVGGVPVALVAVERQSGDRGITETLKTPQSRRVVAVPGRAALRLAELAESGDYLSGDGIGGPSTRFRLRKSWSELPLGDLMHPFRNLRNSYQTWMRWEMRVPPYYIEVLLGHAGKDVTSRFYDRPDADAFAAIVADAYRERPFDSDWTWLDGTDRDASDT